MRISLIVAMDEKRGIGHKGILPWRLSDDLKRFKQLTMGHHLIMGRKTFESVGRVLPGRTTIVVSRKPSPPNLLPHTAGEGKERGVGLLFASSLERALDLARAYGENEVFICGGGEIYAQALPLADRIYLTVVHITAEADVFFPELDTSAWREIGPTHHIANEQNQYPFTWKILERAKTRS
jgi:dihydrofolate reductase